MATTIGKVVRAASSPRPRRPQSFVAKYEGGERRVDVVEFIEICTAIATDKLLKILIQRAA